MGLNHSPRIVTDGLILALDAGNAKSYIGSGTNFTDLSLSLANGTLINGPTFSNNTISFDGTNDYFETTNRVTALEFQPTQAFTIVVWFKTNTTSLTSTALLSNLNSNSPYPGWDILFGGNDLVTMHFISSWTANAIKVGVVYPYTNLLNWTMLGVSYNGSCPTNVTDGINSINFYINGSLYTTTKGMLDSTDGFNSTNETITYDSNQRFRLASRWASGSASVASSVTISSVNIYNRMLSAPEIQQNFNAVRGKFGI